MTKGKGSHKRRNVILTAMVGSILICCIGFCVWDAYDSTTPAYKRSAAARDIGKAKKPTSQAMASATEVARLANAETATIATLTALARLLCLRLPRHLSHRHPPARVDLEVRW